MAICYSFNMTFTIGLAGFLGLYILADLGRILKRRLQPVYLRRAFWRSLVWLLILQVLTVGLGQLVKALNISSSVLIYVMAISQLLVALAIFGFTKRNLRTIKPAVLKDGLASRDLPTVSVCIPARNETDDLRDCLASLVASDYTKLEILVLDDSSQNRQTPEIIRSFAQSGVRFLAGKEPPVRWLAKNYAYQQLAEVANGELLLFCGVDTRFQPQTLSTLVKQLIQKNKSMISLLPRNPDQTGLRSLLIQPARYAWELAEEF
jgi:cellulose synthase/poly-beta-1,6-N-acetylglucosamine synthase-like glycosyltransferase